MNLDEATPDRCNIPETINPQHRPYAGLDDARLTAVTGQLRSTADSAVDDSGEAWATAETQARMAERELAVRASLARTAGARNPANAIRLMFDTRTCGRCGGTGRHSYCTAYQDRCFDCWGSGLALTDAGHQRAREWQSAVRAAREPSASDLAAGDVILTSTNAGYPMSPGNAGTWRKITRIEDTATPAAWRLANHADHGPECGQGVDCGHWEPTTFARRIWIEGFDEPFELGSQTIRRWAELTAPEGPGMLGYVEPAQIPTPRQMAAKRAARTRKLNRAKAAA